MDLKIFDVEHGACSLLTCDNSTRLMIDCGHNSTTGWRPGDYLHSQGISELEMLVVTNYDEDHVSGISNLLDQVFVQWLMRNEDVPGATIRYLKSEDGMGIGIERLVHAINHVFTGGGTATRPVFSGLTYRAFWNTLQDFDDENNLSAVLFLKCHNTGVLFPGDLERRGWLKLLERETFRAVLQDTHVLVASHHGRQSGCCEEIFRYTSPYYVIISDHGYQYETQETVNFYRRFTRGGPFRQNPERHILTTRRDGTIGFNFRVDGWGPY